MIEFMKNIDQFALNHPLLVIWLSLGILSAISLLSSCKQDKHTWYVVDPELDELWNMYKFESWKRGYDPNPLELSYTIKLGDLGGKLGATVHQDNSVLIIIDRKFFYEADKVYNEVNFFHECGHAFRKYSHDQNVIMQRLNVNHRYWPVYKEQWLDDFYGY